MTKYPWFYQAVGGQFAVVERHISCKYFQNTRDVVLHLIGEKVHPIAERLDWREGVNRRRTGKRWVVVCCLLFVVATAEVESFEIWQKISSQLQTQLWLSAPILSLVRSTNFAGIEIFIVSLRSFDLSWSLLISCSWSPHFDPTDSSSEAAAMFQLVVKFQQTCLDVFAYLVNNSFEEPTIFLHPFHSI